MNKNSSGKCSEIINLFVTFFLIFFFFWNRDILCIDKTGTLTMDTAIMVNHFDSWGLPTEKILRFAFLNAYFKTEQKYPLDDAILAYVYTNGFRFQPFQWRKLDEIPFDFTRRRVSVILERKDTDREKNSLILDRLMITKGALEDVINICSYIERVDGVEIIPFSTEDHLRILKMAEELGNDGLRVLGVAMKRLQTVCIYSFCLQIFLSFVFLNLS